MQQDKPDGIEIEQMLMDSLDVGEKYHLSEGRFDQLPVYERREKVTEELYKNYPHVMVTKEDKLFGLKEGRYEFIKDTPGLYKDVLNAGKI